MSSTMHNPKSAYCEYVCSHYLTVPPTGPLTRAWNPVPWQLPQSFQNQGCALRCKSLLDGYGPQVGYGSQVGGYGPQVGAYGPQVGGYGPQGYPQSGPVESLR